MGHIIAVIAIGLVTKVYLSRKVTDWAINSFFTKERYKELSRKERAKKLSRK